MVERYDAVVIGSGAGGLTAALALRCRGAPVALVEADDVVGGTSAIGGGNLWIPGNAAMARAGQTDDLAGAFAYLRRVSGPGPRSANARAFVEHGARLVEFVEAHSLLRFGSIPRYDYHADWDGAGFGRSLEPAPFAAGDLLRERASWFRTNPTRAPLTYVEYRQGADAELIASRHAEDIRTQGAALVAGLGHACLTRGVEVVKRSPAITVTHDSGGGYVVELAGSRTLRAPALVIATGGFAHSPQLRRAFLPAIDFETLSVGRGVGDGLRFGLGCGAALFGIGDGWLGATHVPGNGGPASLVVRELALPGSMLVNRDGRRFVNEALGYNDVGKGMLAFDPARGSFFCAHSWLVFDAAFRARHPVLGVSPDDPPAASWKQANDLSALALALALPKGELEQSVERMNEAAASGSDREFGRGSDAHQRFNGDAGHSPNPCLGPIATPPFFAAPIKLGLCNTKGGLDVDSHARVLNCDGSPIPGLYAVGDVAATVMGYGYAGAGASLGPAMTFGMMAAESIATGGE
jgi:succinate dehydrogenase/fumarate reductase flavoprotein subunit